MVVLKLRWGFNDIILFNKNFYNVFEILTYEREAEMNNQEIFMKLFRYNFISILNYEILFASFRHKKLLHIFSLRGILLT